MDKQQAKDLIHKLFSQSFDQQRFEYFLRNLLNRFEPRNGHYTGNYIPASFREHVRQYWRIGKYVDPEGEELDLLVVEVSSFAKLERARSSLRNFAVDRLKKFEKEASLIAFYAKDDGGADWRFSFVKIEHEAYRNKQGKIKIRQQLTPAKRYSYLVGVHENSHTAAKQLLPVLTMDYADPSLEDIEAAFSVEKVSDEFFEQYRQLFISLSAHLQSQPFFQKDSEEENARAISRFAKKLLGQIVFLYFLQKKGWLGVPKGGNWSEGSKRFMREQYEQVAEKGGNYFHDFLRYLFYEALAQERQAEDSGYYARFDCKIPFLNGGLFEAEYVWQDETIDLPNRLFHNQEKNKAGDQGTGILDVFDRYNFTIKEDEPLEKEVAVDPEMLGKVFENMLEITERKSKGAFYTPREIVHYICQESLISYLDDVINNTGIQNEDSPDSLLPETFETNRLVPRENLDTLIRRGHLALENDQRVLSKGKESSTYKFQLPESIRKNACEIDDALADVKACDPAIGSGAFPVGLLHEIVGARLALAPHSGNSSTPYEFKRHAIRESIYGVDIDASAIDIARLRLWLSLIVDEERFDTIEPLPNLDYKIIQGDSLVEKYGGIKLFNEAFLQEDATEEMLEKIKEKEKELKREGGLIRKKRYYADRQNKEEESALCQGKLQQLDKQLKSLKRQMQALLKKSQHEKDTNGRIIDFYVNEARNKARQLETLHQEFFNKTSLPEKRKLRREINRLEWELVEATLKEQNRLDILDELREYRASGEKPWFIWQLNFSEVFKSKGGFDIVIGNPPYVQIQKFSGQRIQKEWQQQGYETFTKTGDIYCLFYEKGYHILREGGVLAFITSNKWMRAAYGKKLREFFKNKVVVEQLIDFGDSPIFSEATTYTNIMLFRKTIGNSPAKTWDLSSSYKAATSLEQMLEDRGQSMPVFDTEGYVLLEPHLAVIKKRIEEVGTPLKEWDVSIYRGILTGFNEAFIIDGKKKEELIAADPKSAEIIKPILRGRDIKRYRIDFSDKWLIATFPALNLDIEEYPAICDYLKSFGRKLHQTGEIIGKDASGNPIKSRKKTGNRWFETQDQIAYYKEFEKEKVVWAEIVFDSAFYHDTSGIFPEATAFVMTGERTKFLTAMLNSRLLTFAFRAYYAGGDLRGETFRYKKAFLMNLPIIKAKEQIHNSIEYFVDFIQTAKSKNKNLESSFFEQLIDGLVYELYFSEEIKAAGKDILPHLGEFEPLTNDMSEDEKLVIIQRQFNRLYDPSHPVRNAIETLDNVEVVRTVRQALKK